MGRYHPIITAAAEPAADEVVAGIDPALADGNADPAAGEALLPVPVPVEPRSHGWTVERQRGFLEALGDTGSVTEAAAAVGMTAKSAYRLRARPDAEAFDLGWKLALRLASSHLAAVAWDRAVNGAERTKWHKGEAVGTERVPSDRLLMFLLKAHDPWSYSVESNHNADPRSAAREHLARQLGALVDPDAPGPARRKRASRV